MSNCERCDSENVDEDIIDCETCGDAVEVIRCRDCGHVEEHHLGDEECHDDE